MHVTNKSHARKQQPADIWPKIVNLNHDIYKY